VRSGTGESANYRSARRARSRAELIAKLGVAAEEADEAGQLRAILVQSVKTARANHRKSTNP